MFPLGINTPHWPVCTRILLASGNSVYCSVRETLIGETHWPVATNCGFKLWLTSNTHTEQRQPRSMAEGLGAGGGEECTGFSPLSVSTTNAASPRVVPLGSLVSSAPTATPSRRTLIEDLAKRLAETVKR